MFLFLKNVGLMILITMVILVLGLFGLYQYRKANIRTSYQPKEIPAGVDKDTYLFLGSLNASRENHFTKFVRKKGRGTFRIGAFGDSHTFGQESNQVYNYPHFLEELFREAGFTNIEVLNFGNGWHGFHQTYEVFKGIGLCTTVSCDANWEN